MYNTTKDPNGKDVPDLNNPKKKTIGYASLDGVSGSTNRFERGNDTTNDVNIGVSGSIGVGPVNAPVGIGARVATKQSVDPITGEKTVKRGVVLNPNIAGFGVEIALGNKDAVKIDNKFNLRITKSDIETLNKKSPLYVKCDVRKLTQVGLSSRMQETSQVLEFGVKSVLHLMKSDDIIYNLGTTSRSDNALFKFVRWTTGELKLFKDLIFDYDYNKKLAKDTRRSDNYWWYKLRRLGKTASFRAKLKTKNVPTPITTLILSKDEMDTIRLKYGVDLFNARAARSILDNYFLLNFCYIDESAEIIYILDEFSNSYEAFSFDSIRVKSDKNTKEDLMDIMSMFTRL